MESAIGGIFPILLYLEQEDIAFTRYCVKSEIGKIGKAAHSHGRVVKYTVTNMLIISIIFVLQAQGPAKSTPAIINSHNDISFIRLYSRIHDP